MYTLRYRSELDPATARELDGFATTATAWGAKAHDETGANLDGVPIGATVGWPDTIPVPARWLRCNGGHYSRTTYAGLFKVYGVTIGVGDGSTTFKIPNTANTIIYAGV